MKRKSFLAFMLCVVFCCMTVLAVACKKTPNEPIAKEGTTKEFTLDIKEGSTTKQKEITIADYIDENQAEGVTYTATIASGTGKITVGSIASGKVTVTGASVTASGVPATVALKAFREDEAKVTVTLSFTVVDTTPAPDPVPTVIDGTTKAFTLDIKTTSTTKAKEITIADYIAENSATGVTYATTVTEGASFVTVSSIASGKFTITGAAVGTAKVKLDAKVGTDIKASVEFTITVSDSTIPISLVTPAPAAQSVALFTIAEAAGQKGTFNKATINPAHYIDATAVTGTVTYELVVKTGKGIVTNPTAPATEFTFQPQKTGANVLTLSAKVNGVKEIETDITVNATMPNTDLRGEWLDASSWTERNSTGTGTVTYDTTNKALVFTDSVQYRNSFANGNQTGNTNSGEQGNGEHFLNGKTYHYAFELKSEDAFTLGLFCSSSFNHIASSTAGNGMKLSINDAGVITVSAQQGTTTNIIGTASTSAFNKTAWNRFDVFFTSTVVATGETPTYAGSLILTVYINGEKVDFVLGTTNVDTTLTEPNRKLTSASNYGNNFFVDSLGATVNVRAVIVNPMSVAGASKTVNLDIEAASTTKTKEITIADYINENTATGITYSVEAAAEQTVATVGAISEGKFTITAGTVGTTTVTLYTKQNGVTKITTVFNITVVDTTPVPEAIAGADLELEIDLASSPATQEIILAEYVNENEVENVTYEVLVGDDTIVTIDEDEPTVSFTITAAQEGETTITIKVLVDGVEKLTIVLEVEVVNSAIPEPTLVKGATEDVELDLAEAGSSDEKLITIAEYINAHASYTFEVEIKDGSSVVSVSTTEPTTSFTIEALAIGTAEVELHVMSGQTVKLTVTFNITVEKSDIDITIIAPVPANKTVTIFTLAAAAGEKGTFNTVAINPAEYVTVGTITPYTATYELAVKTGKGTITGTTTFVFTPQSTGNTVLTLKVLVNGIVVKTTEITVEVSMPTTAPFEITDASKWNQKVENIDPVAIPTTDASTTALVFDNIISAKSNAFDSGNMTSSSSSDGQAFSELFLYGKTYHYSFAIKSATAFKLYFLATTNNGEFFIGNAGNAFGIEFDGTTFVAKSQQGSNSVATHGSVGKTAAEYSTENWNRFDIFLQSTSTNIPGKIIMIIYINGVKVDFTNSKATSGGNDKDADEPTRNLSNLSNYGRNFVIDARGGLVSLKAAEAGVYSYPANND